jgi:hypothetical protein
MLGIKGNAHAPISRVAAISIAASGLDEGFDIRTSDVGTHDSHSLAIRPIQLAVPFIEVELFRGEGASLRNYDGAIPSVEVRTLDRPVIQVRNTHVRPVEISGIDIDDDAVREMATVHKQPLVRTICIHGRDLATAQLQNEQAIATPFIRTLIWVLIRHILNTPLLVKIVLNVEPREYYMFLLCFRFRVRLGRKLRRK